MSVHVQESENGIPAHLADAFRTLNNDAFDLSRREYRPYAGQRFADLPKELQEYLRLSQQEVNPRLFDEALVRANSGVSRLPQQYEQYINPYRQEVTNRLTEASERNANRMVSELQKVFGVGPQSRNSGLSREVLQEAQQLAKRREEESLARGHQSAIASFGLDRARELHAADILNKMALMEQATRNQEAQTLREAGLLRHDNEQRARDLAYEEWKERKRHPHESLMEYFNILKGVPYVRSTYEKSQDITPRQLWHGKDWMDFGGGVLLNMLSKGLGRSRSPEPKGRRLSMMPEGYVERAAQEGLARLPSGRGERRSQPYSHATDSSSSSHSSSPSAPSSQSSGDRKQQIEVDIRNTENFKAYKKSIENGFWKQPYDRNVDFVSLFNKKIKEVDDEYDARKSKPRQISHNEQERERMKKRSLIQRFNAGDSLNMWGTD